MCFSIINFTSNFTTSLFFRCFVTFFTTYFFATEKSLQKITNLWETHVRKNSETPNNQFENHDNPRKIPVKRTFLQDTMCIGSHPKCNLNAGLSLAPTSGRASQVRPFAGLRRDTTRAHTMVPPREGVVIT